jgi:hypothetical protein
MTKLTFYGRRILKIKINKTGDAIFRSSGQWVGHTYGKEFGTDRQRKNYYCPETETLLGVSKKIFWKGIEETLTDINYCDSLIYIL